MAAAPPAIVMRRPPRCEDNCDFGVLLGPGAFALEVFDLTGAALPQEVFHHWSGAALYGPSFTWALAPASTSFRTASSEPEHTALCSAVALGLSPTFGALGSAPSAIAVLIASSLPL